MNDSMYEAIAYVMRYWFIFVVVGLLIAMIYISHREISEKKQIKTEMGKYGGYLEIVGGPREFLGDRFGIADQNTIGSAAKADIIIPGRHIEKTHALLYKQGEDLILSPVQKADTKINGRRAISPHALKTGDVITIGNVDLRVYIKRTRLRHDD